MKNELELYLHEISKSRPLTSEEETSLAIRIKRGDREARNKLIKANVRFVVSVAKNYQNQGISLSDLISAGNVGLIRAAERFDEKKGCRFISYCVWWIRQSILLELANQSRLVRIPLNASDTLHDIYKCEARLEQEYGRMPTQEEISRELGIESEKLESLFSARDASLSLDTPLEQGSDSTLLDMLTSEEDNPEEKDYLQDVAHEIFSLLDPREQEIFRLYFGFDNDSVTLNDIGIKLGCTRERVRQIKAKALERLRRLKKVQSLVR